MSPVRTSEDHEHTIAEIWGVDLCERRKMRLGSCYYTIAMTREGPGQLLAAVNSKYWVVRAVRGR